MGLRLKKTIYVDYLPGYTGFTAKSYLQVTDCPFSTNFDPPSSHCPYPNDKQTSKLIWDIFLIDIIKARVRLVPLLSLTALSWSCRRFIAWGRPNEVIAPYDLVVLLMLALKTPPIAGNCFSGWLTITYEGFSDLFFFSKLQYFSSVWQEQYRAAFQSTEVILFLPAAQRLSLIEVRVQKKQQVTFAFYVVLLV